MLPREGRTPSLQTPRRAGVRRTALLVCSVLVVILDRLTKLWIERRIPEGSAIPIIPRIFRLTHVLNSGAGFSLFADSLSPGTVRTGLVLFSSLAVLVVAGLIWRQRAPLTAASWGLALILGGAVGNLYDRVRFGLVTDFLEVHIVHYHWPDFNVADSAIVVGASLLVLDALRSPAGLDS